MRKILLLSAASKSTYRTRKELVSELLKQGYELDIHCPYGKELDYFENWGARLHHIPFDNQGKNPLKELLLFLRLMHSIRKIKPDIILSYTIKMNIYSGIIARIFNLTFIPNITGLGNGFSQSRTFEKLLIKMYQVAFRKVHHVFFQNRDNQMYFEENNILNSPYTILSGSGVNLQEYQVVPIKHSKEKNFLFLARILKDKGIEEFLSAAEAITKDRSDGIFHVAGQLEEDYQGMIQTYVDKGIIQYHGDVDDVQQLIAEMEVVVLPSYHEGMANTLLEAAAMGRPLITSDISGCKEAVKNGISGYAVPPREVAPLVEAMQAVLALNQTELTEMGLQGRKIAEEHFDRQPIVKKYLEVVQESVYSMASEEENNEEFS